MRTAGVKGARNALQYPSLFERDDFRKAAEMLLELNRNGAFSEDAFSMGYVDMVESFRKGEAAMMYQGDFVANLLGAEDSPVKDSIVVVPFPVVPGGNGSAYEFLGGNQDSFYIRADTAHPREAVEVLLHISERAGKEVEAEGMGTSCWITEPGMVSVAPPVQSQSIALMQTGLDFLGWWDTILPASSADTHKELVADLLDNRITAEEFTAEMAKLIGAQP
jgi:raffinose/stachyose/melibiose transport system substrate-binding protein